jgi:hypothetical protein
MLFIVGCTNNDADYYPLSQDKFLKVTQGSYFMTSHDFICVAFDENGNRHVVPGVSPIDNKTGSYKDIKEYHKEWKIYQEVAKKKYLYIFSADADYIYSRIDNELQKINTDQQIIDLLYTKQKERLERLVTKSKTVLDELERANFSDFDKQDKAQVEVLLKDLDRYSEVIGAGLK